MVATNFFYTFWCWRELCRETCQSPNNFSWLASFLVRAPNSAPGTNVFESPAGQNLVPWGPGLPHTCIVFIFDHGYILQFTNPFKQKKFSYLHASTHLNSFSISAPGTNVFESPAGQNLAPWGSGLPHTCIVFIFDHGDILQFTSPFKQKNSHICTRQPT